MAPNKGAKSIPYYVVSGMSHCESQNHDKQSCVYVHVNMHISFWEIQGGAERMDSPIFKSGDYNFNLIASI